METFNENNLIYLDIIVIGYNHQENLFKNKACYWSYKEKLITTYMNHAYCVGYRNEKRKISTVCVAKANFDEFINSKTGYFFINGQ